MIRVAPYSLLLLFCTGCMGYHVGARSLYSPDITTVYVPIFESDSFRRDQGERITEAVVKEIELKTPFKVVGSPNADSILSGRLVRDTKRVLVENTNDEPREIEVNYDVEVSWVDRRGDLIRQRAMIDVSPEVISIGQSATLVPESGQSLATSQQQAINRLAEQIVATMEVPW